jgi:hypothetical protein
VFIDVNANFLVFCKRYLDTKTGRKINIKHANNLGLKIKIGDALSALNIASFPYFISKLVIKSNPNVK